MCTLHECKKLQNRRHSPTYWAKFNSPCIVTGCMKLGSIIGGPNIPLQSVRFKSTFSVSSCNHIAHNTVKSPRSHQPWNYIQSFWFKSTFSASSYNHIAHNTVKSPRSCQPWNYNQSFWFMSAFSASSWNHIAHNKVKSPSTMKLYSVVLIQVSILYFILQSHCTQYSKITVNHEIIFTSCRKHLIIWRVFPVFVKVHKM